MEQNEGEEPKLGIPQGVVNEARARVARRPIPRYVARMRIIRNNGCFSGAGPYARVRGRA